VIRGQGCGANLHLASPICPAEQDPILLQTRPPPRNPETHSHRSGAISRTLSHGLISQLARAARLGLRPDRHRSTSLTLRSGTRGRTAPRGPRSPLDFGLRLCPLWIFAAGMRTELLRWTDRTDH
jgi:hypothetical protein